MNIYTEPGSMVKFTGKGGYVSDRELGNKHLDTETIYTVSRIVINGWSSEVYLELEGLEKIGFNTVMFENIDL